MHDFKSVNLSKATLNSAQLHEAAALREELVARAIHGVAAALVHELGVGRDDAALYVTSLANLTWELCDQLAVREVWERSRRDSGEEGRP